MDWRLTRALAEHLLTPQQRWAVVKAQALRNIEKGKFIQDPETGLLEGSEPGGGEGGTGGGGKPGEGKPEGGGKGKHPGKGYSKEAYIDKHGVIQTSNVYDAQRALYEDKKVELTQPKQVSTLIKLLGKSAAAMEAKGKTAPVFNLCNVSISGTNLFCAESKGIERAEMPVIPAKQTQKFVDYLKSQGYKAKKGKEYAANLRATQDEISGVKVAAAMKRIKDNKGEVYKRIIVSKDDYILDGHHTWAGALGIDAKNNNLHDDKSVKVFRINISITKLIAEAELWTGGKGKKPASEAAEFIPVGKAWREDPAVYDMTD